MTNPAPIQLEYGQQPRRVRAFVRRWWKLGLAAALVVAAIALGPRVVRRVDLLLWQHRCMTDVLPADAVVYEEDAREVQKLLAQGEYLPMNPVGTRGRSALPQLKRGAGATTMPSTVAIYRPTRWDRFLGLAAPNLVKMIGMPSSGAVLFLGTLKTPAGESRLVEVEYAADYSSFQPAVVQGFNCITHVYAPGTLFRAPVETPLFFSLSVLSGPLDRPPGLRFYAGQVDPTDPTHFTVHYELWGQQDVIDGNVDNQGRVALKQRKLPHWPAR